MSVWGKGQLVVKRQAQEVNPQILNHTDGLVLEEGVDWADLNDCFFNIPPGSKVEIGKGIKIGLGCQITTAYHPVHPAFRCITKTKDIKIGQGVFIGTGVIIIGGVTIGDNSYIGAGSVITRDIPPNSFAVGSPARIVCSVWEWKDD